MIEMVGPAVLGIVLLNFVGLHSDVIRSNWLMVLPRQTVNNFNSYPWHLRLTLMIQIALLVASHFHHLCMPIR